MSRGRIAYATEERLLLTFDGHLLLAFDGATLAPKWQLPFDAPLAAVVLASSHAVPRVHAGNPWRASASGSDALVIDREGGIHAIDVALGRVVGSLAPVGAPVAVAAAADLAIALADRVLLWHDGQRHSLDLRATALAFSRDGLMLAVGSAKGEVHEITLATRAIESRGIVKGVVAAIVPRRAGEWVVATDAEVHHVTAYQVRRLRESGATEIACDAKGHVLALQQAVDRVLVCEWPSSPVTRIEMAGRTISDLALSGDRLALAVHGGDANVVNLRSREHSATKEHPGRTSRRWTLDVMAEKDATSRWEGTANRFGIGAFLTLGVILLCMGYLSSSSHQNWVPPPPFLVTESCNADCELTRARELREACEHATEVDCASDAEEVEAALETGICDEARTALGRVRHRLGARDDGGHAQLGAKLAQTESGLERGCAPASTEKKQLEVVRLTPDGEYFQTEYDRTPLVGEEPQAIWAGEDATLILATITRGRAAIRRKTPGIGWRTMLVEPGCASAHLWTKNADDVYASLGSKVWHYDGRVWNDLSFPGLEVKSLRGTSDEVFAVDMAGAIYAHGRRPGWEREELPEGVQAKELASTTASVWGLGVKEKTASFVFLRQSAGVSWASTAMNAGSFGEMWAAPDRTVFAATGWATVATWGALDEMKTWNLPAIAEHLWGRSSHDVYAAGAGGLVHFDGASWEATSFHQHVRAIGGNSRSVWVVAEK